MTSNDKNSVYVQKRHIQILSKPSADACEIFRDIGLNDNVIDTIAILVLGIQKLDERRRDQRCGNRHEKYGREKMSAYDTEAEADLCNHDSNLTARHHTDTDLRHFTSRHSPRTQAASDELCDNGGDRNDDRERDDRHISKDGEVELHTDIDEEE